MYSENEYSEKTSCCCPETEKHPENRILINILQKNVFNFSYQKNVFNFSRYSDSGILHRVRVESPTGKCGLGCCDPSSLCISPPKYRLGSK